jgi:hypothetical protein
MRQAKHSGTRSFALLFSLLALFQTAPAAHAEVPWPDGCTLTTSSTKPSLQIWLQQGLDKIFLGACNHHDRCYGTCNTENPPYLGTSFKTSCDVTLLIELEAACTLWAGILTFPIDDDLQTAQNWITYCNGVLAPSMFAAVSLFGTNAFWGDQCVRGCNPNGCQNHVPPQSFPPVPSCGGWYRGELGTISIFTGYPEECYIDVPFNFCQPEVCSGERFGCYWDNVNCQCECSPVILDVEGNGFHLTNSEHGVPFDLPGHGVKKQMAWTAAGFGNAFLALDRNGNGVIDDGTELFGNYTEQADSDHRNGFSALAEYDNPEVGGTGDGVIDSRDLIYKSLLLWTDENHDGLTQPGELRSLASWGVEAIELQYGEARRQDRFGNEFKYRARIRKAPGHGGERWAYDVFLLMQP